MITSRTRLRNFLIKALICVAWVAFWVAERTPKMRQLAKHLFAVNGEVQWRYRDGSFQRSSSCVRYDRSRREPRSRRSLGVTRSIRRC